MPLPTPPDEYVDVEGYGLYEWIDVIWTPLLDGASLKNDDTPIPGAVGDYVNPRVIDASTIYVCNGWIHGTTLFDGTVASDDAEARAFLRENLAFMRGFICSPTFPSSPLRTLTLHGDPDWSAEVVIDRHLSLADESEFCYSIILKIKAPETGELVAEGS